MGRSGPLTFAHLLEKSIRLSEYFATPKSVRLSGRYGLGPSRLSTYATENLVANYELSGLAPSRLRTYCTRLHSSSISRLALLTLAIDSIS